MIKTTKILCACLLFLLIQGCVDFHTSQRPIDYEGTKWISEQPDIYFEVNNQEASGTVNINSTAIKVYVAFDHGTGIYFHRADDVTIITNEFGQEIKALSDETLLFSGLCTFSREKVIVSIVDNEKGFLDVSTKELIFLREETPEAQGDEKRGKQGDG